MKPERVITCTVTVQDGATEMSVARCLVEAGVPINPLDQKLLYGKLDYNLHPDNYHIRHYIWRGEDRRI